MAKARSPAGDQEMTTQELAKQDYISGAKQKDIAKKYDISVNTLKSWIKRHNWKNDKVAPTKKVAPKIKKVAPLEIKVQEIDNDDLNDKQKLFCYYYVKYWNATKAYQKAYGCSYATAMVEGSKHLRNPKIAKEIDRLKQELFTDVGLDAKTFGKALLQKHIDIAFADITDFLSFGRKEIVTADGNTKMVNFVHLKKSDEIDGTIINEIKEGREGVSIKLANREKSLDFLTKHYDLLEEEDKKTLQAAKLYYEVAKAKKEADSSSDSDNEQVVFVDSDEAMARYIAEHGDANGQSK